MAKKTKEIEYPLCPFVLTRVADILGPCDGVGSSPHALVSFDGALFFHDDNGPTMIIREDLPEPTQLMLVGLCAMGGVDWHILPQSEDEYVDEDDEAEAA